MCTIYSVDPIQHSGACEGIQNWTKILANSSLCLFLTSITFQTCGDSRVRKMFKVLKDNSGILKPGHRFHIFWGLNN